MLWKNRRESGNILDQRRFGGKTLGIGGLVLGAIVYGIMGGNPLDYIAQNSDQLRTQQSAPDGATRGGTADDEEQKRFVAVVLRDTEDVWNEVFRANQSVYREPKLVLFTQAVQSACGRASAAVGPFYCPSDERIYIDLKFFNQLSRSLGAKGDFAQAYVIAHEVGHHVQNLLGVENFRNSHSARSARARNQMSVQVELQADCLAGVWAKQTDQAKKVIEEGDVDEAMNAAAAVGDDRLQQASRGEVMPDSFTHGSSAQRVQAFRLGFSDGQPQACLDSYR
jgi:predicted metalloprotease